MDLREKWQTTRSAPGEESGADDGTEEGIESKESSEKLRRGKITRWIKDRGFGFLRLDKPLPDGKREVFVHVTNLSDKARTAIESGNTEIELFLNPVKGERGWQADIQGVIDSEEKSRRELVTLREGAQTIFERAMGAEWVNKHGLLLGSYAFSKANGATEAEIIASALKESGSYSFPRFNDEEAKRFAAGVTSADIGSITEFQKNVSDYQAEQQRIGQEAEKARELAFEEGIKRQEDYSRTEEWAEAKAAATRQWFAGSGIDPAYFSLSVVERIIMGGGPNPSYFNEDRYESWVIGTAYAIIAHDARKADKEVRGTSQEFEIDLRDQLLNDKFFQETDFPMEKGALFEGFVRKEGAAGARDGIAALLPDIYAQQEERISEQYSEALALKQVVEEYLEKREGLRAVIGEAYRYGLRSYDIVPEYGKGDVDRYDEQKLRDGMREMDEREARIRELMAPVVAERTRQEQEYKGRIEAKQEALQNEKDQSAADEEKYGVSGGDLDVARALAESARQKLGLERAIALFDKNANAEYGRQRRQDDIRRSLGNDLSDVIGRFFDLTKSGDVAAILEAGLIVLRESNERGPNRKAGEKLQNPQGQPEAEIDPNSPFAKLAALRNKSEGNK
ncbi:cold shock domain-containing protein [Candidatus Kaiserbacteria bacterium]|nr:cold shock domain-containing protein [Candidatus Kaiserbacteria bacterium]